MTRFGVMKHLKVLEEAGLVVTRRRGREKLHFLNPVPIRLVHDRWVSKYAEPWVAGLSEIKRDWRARWKRCTRSTSGPRPSAVGGDRRPRDPGQVQLRRRGESEWKVGAPISVDVASRVSISERARCSSTIRPAAWCTRWRRCGTTT